MDEEACTGPDCETGSENSCELDDADGEHDLLDSGIWARVVEKPKICSKKVITVYCFSLVFLFLTVIVTGILAATPPHKHTYSQMVSPGDLIVIPVIPRPVWLSDLSVTASASCFGLFFTTFCNDLIVLSDPNYPMPYYEPVYCLEHSSFVFHASPNQSEKVFIWLFDENTKPPDVMKNKSCVTDPTIPGKQVCVELNSSRSFCRIKVWHKGLYGAYYYWRSWPQGTVDGRYVERYYYDAEGYTTDDNAKNNLDSFQKQYHNGFHPTDFADNDSCLMLYLNSKVNRQDCGGIEVETHRRFDILFWPGLAGFFIVLVIVVLLIIHLSHYAVKKTIYNQHRENEME